MRLVLPLPLRRYFRQQLTQGANLWKEERRIDVRSMLRREVMNKPRGPALVGLHPSLRNEGPGQHERDKYATARGDAYKPRANARGPRPSKRQRTQPDGEVS